MATLFQLSFEQVQLLSGLNPDQGVYLLLQGKAYNPDTPDDPFYMATIGGLSPNDANAPGGDIVSGTGFYAASLPVGVTIRNDVPDGYGRPTPRFALPLLSIEPDQIFELSIVLAPEVWFTTVNVPPSDWDKVLDTIFWGALGSGGFGIGGALAGAFLGFIGFGSTSQDVQVPCYNVVIGARHQWTGDELGQFAGQGMLQFGPTGPDPSYGCPRIDSFYWLSVSDQTQYQFGTSTPPAKGDCTVDVVDDMTLAPRFQNNWGDRGIETLDCARAIVYPANGNWNVSLWDPEQLVNPALEFHNVPVTSEWPLPVFRRNIYPDRSCPAQSVTPSCPTCSRFTNVDAGMFLPGKLLFGVGLRSTHIGARPLLGLQFDNDRVLGSGPTAAVPSALHPSPKGSHRRVSGKSAHRRLLPTASPLRVNPSTIIHEPAPGMVVLSGKLNVPLNDLGESIPIGRLFQALTLRLSPTRVLYLYGEYPVTGDLQCFRLRYRMVNEQGVTVTDLMFLPDAPVIG